jgi:hypothetical protein
MAKLTTELRVPLLNLMLFHCHLFKRLDLYLEAFPSTLDILERKRQRKCEQIAIIILRGDTSHSHHHPPTSLETFIESLLCITYAFNTGDAFKKAPFPQVSENFNKLTTTMIVTYLRGQS